MSKEEEALYNYKINEIVLLLNSFLEVDRVAVSNIFTYLIRCRKELSTTKVEVMQIASDIFAFNTLGLLNALLPVETGEDSCRICFTSHSSGLIDKFFIHQNFQEPSNDQPRI